MGRFILFGGADIRERDRAADSFAVALARTGEGKPRVLYLPQANGESKPSVNTFYKIYTKLKTKPSCALFKNGEMDGEHIAEKFSAADMVYIGGGDFMRLKTACASMGLDAMLREAAQRNVLLAGNSAGALYLCSRGISDYQITGGVSDELCETEGLGLIDVAFTPHADEKRVELLEKTAEKYGLKPVFLTENQAVYIETEGKNVSKIQKIV